MSASRAAANGTTAIPWRSSRRRPSLLQQLKLCQEAWCPRGPWDREGAHAALCGAPAGSFLVVRHSAASRPGVLCVSAGDSGPVTDHQIQSTDSGLQLSESRLSFSDLAQLVLFYCLTRDVLDVCLFIPHWIYRITDQNTDHLSHLEPNTWLRPSQQAGEMTPMEPSTIVCSIQLTSTSGAMCVINPLYLREHGDDWLTHRAAQSFRQERRLSRKWAGPHSKRTMSLEQEAADVEASGLVRTRSAESPHGAPVVLRRPSRDFDSTPPHRASTESLPGSASSSPGSSNRASFELQPHGSPAPPQSPHRVSWIEDGVWLPPPRSSHSLHPPSAELDSLSISSIEEEQELQAQSAASHHPSAHRLADKVLHRLSAVGQALGGLVSQKKRLSNRVKEMSERKGAPFAEAVKEFVEVMLKKDAGHHGEVTEFLQEVRSSLSSLRDTLLDSAEIQALLDSITDMSDSEIDSLVELSLHKVALKPVSSHLYSCIRASRSFERLQSNMRLLEKNGVEELGGAAGVGIPDSVTLERIQQRFTRMHEVYSPNKKVQILLKVCKSIYHSMSANASSGKVFGADDFLPCLTWVLLRSDVLTLQLDTDYMMELLDPAQLQGEGGYYLTTLYASLYYISSFQPRLAARQLSVEAQKSLNQWHRRRTLHCNQSRRSRNRRTIRRQAHKSGQKCVTGRDSEKESEMSTEALKEETSCGQEAEDQPHMSVPASDITRSQEEGGQTLEDRGGHSAVTPHL